MSSLSSRTPPSPKSNSRSPTPNTRSRSPTPNALSRSPTPKSSSKSTTPKSRSRKSSQRDHSHKSRKNNHQNRIYPDFIYQLDVFDFLLILLSVFLFFVTLSVGTSNIDVKDKELEKYDYRTGLQRFLLIVISLLLIGLAAKKYFHIPNKK